MAYIDRDKVLKAVEKMDRLDKETKTKYEYDKKGFLLLINSAPTADVVEVVRCKDCKYSVLLGNIEIDGIEEPCTIKCKYESYILGADDFCSLGERKDEKKKL